jgi:23S rRNA (cytidine1920-2'-O)/16S rRNA (cytidine1409-2'-O)-methyltransferase
MKKNARKERIDKVLVNRGLIQSRERAKAMIMAGSVLVKTEVIDKPGTLIDEDAEITLKSHDFQYVSRGGLKLAGALETFAIAVRDRIVVDIGASTGGFTDCLLQQGASRVYAIDVGYGQLAWKLQQDARVTIIDRTNIRYFDPARLDPRPSLATIDVSFISLTLVLPKAAEIILPGGDIIALIKPQFEVGREQMEKGGIIKDPLKHDQVTQKIQASAVLLGLEVCGLIDSPIVGAEGNKEFLIHLHKP